MSSPNRHRSQAASVQRDLSAASQESDLSPEVGDVVVTREARSPVRFTVRQVPAVVQISASTRDDAMRVARAFALRHALDGWYGDDDGFRLLEAYRVRAKDDTDPRASGAASRKGFQIVHGNEA